MKRWWKSVLPVGSADTGSASNHLIRSLMWSLILKMQNLNSQSVVTNTSKVQGPPNCSHVKYHLLQQRIGWVCAGQMKAGNISNSPRIPHLSFRSSYPSPLLLISPLSFLSADAAADMQQICRRVELIKYCWKKNTSIEVSLPTQ